MKEDGGGGKGQRGKAKLVHKRTLCLVPSALDRMATTMATIILIYYYVFVIMAWR